MSRNLICTGGLGFIGTAFLNSYRHLWDRVIVLDCLLPQVHSRGMRKYEKDDVEILSVEISNMRQLDRIKVSGEFDVLHMASETGTGESINIADVHTTTNVLGSLNLVRWLSGNKVKCSKVVNVSSRAVYGEGSYLVEKTVTNALPRTHFDPQCEEYAFEDFVPHNVSQLAIPTSVYGVTKLAQEGMITSLSMSERMSVIHLRLQNVIGPGQSPNNPYTGVIPFFINRVRSGEPIKVFEDGLIYRDFIDVKDVCEVIRRTFFDSEISSGVYDVGSMQATSILDLAEALISVMGSGSYEISGEFRIGDVRNAVASSCLYLDRFTPLSESLEEIVCAYS